MFTKLIEKFKKWYFKNVVLVCSNEDEAAIAEAVINKYGGKILRERSWRARALIYSMVPWYLRQDEDVTSYAVRTRNFDVASQLLEEFLKETNGYLINVNPIIEDYLE